MKAPVMPRLLKCTRAVVTIELAILIPVMWAFLAGSVDVVDLVYTVFEVNSAASTTANAVSQLPQRNFSNTGITQVLQFVNAASQPVNVAGSNGAVIITVVTHSPATTQIPNPVPQAQWQCINTTMKIPPRSNVGTPGGGTTNGGTPGGGAGNGKSVPAILPPAHDGFPALVMDASDTAIIAESFYTYSPWIFGSGFFGLAVYQIYNEAIFRPRVESLSSLLTGEGPGSYLISPTTTGTC
jgi:Flp pilus assembly protein TadG